MAPDSLPIPDARFPSPQPSPRWGEGEDGSPDPSILVLGDLLLDVVIDGSIATDSDAPGMMAVFPGGAAANFAVGAAGLGARVRFVGRVGDDAGGRLLINDLAAAHVEPVVRAVPGLRTGNVLVLRNVDGRGGSRMRSDPGASSTLAADDLDPALFDRIACLHLTGYSFLRPGPRAAAHAAVALCRQRSPAALLTLDPGPAHLIGEAGAAWFRELLAGLRPDVLLPNHEEARLLAAEDEPERIVESLLEIAPCVALKLGAAGSLVAWGEQRHREPAAPVTVVDATGAGDAYAAGFVVALLTGAPPDVAAASGSQAAALVVGRSGAR